MHPSGRSSARGIKKEDSKCKPQKAVEYSRKPTKNRLKNPKKENHLKKSA
jgi:hypothetical protein